MSLRIVGLNENEDAEVTAAGYTVLFDDSELKRFAVADVAPVIFQKPLERSCRAIDIDPLRRGKIVPYDYPGARIVDLLQDAKSVQSSLPPKRVTLRSHRSLRIVDLDRDADVGRTGVSFVVLFDDTEQNRAMVATVSIQFHEPLGRFCRALDVESLQQGKLVARDYDAYVISQAIKRRCRADSKAYLESRSN